MSSGRGPIRTPYARTVRNPLAQRPPPAMAAPTIPLHEPAWVREFKAFIMRGNVVDLAVGIIIGAAFTAIVSSVGRGPGQPFS